MTSVPYIISIAYPDYKRPYLHQEFGVCKDEDVPNLFIDKCAEFIFDRTSDGDIESCQDINAFFENYFEYYYMDNMPWEATVFLDGEWVSIIPTDEELFNKIQFFKQKCSEVIHQDIDVQSELFYEEESDKLDISQEDEDFFKMFYGKLIEPTNYKERDTSLPSELRKKNFITHILSVLNENFVKNNQEITKQFIEKVTYYIDKEIEIKSKELKTSNDQETNHNEATEQHEETEDDKKIEVNESKEKSELADYLSNLISLRANISAYQCFMKKIN
jgi:hypothetical protein